MKVFKSNQSHSVILTVKKSIVQWCCWGRTIYPQFYNYRAPRSVQERSKVRKKETESGRKEVEKGKREEGNKKRKEEREQRKKTRNEETN